MYQYLYVAQYVHNRGRLEDVTEKKISTTKKLDLEALQREMQGVLGPIVCSVMAAWKVEDESNHVKSALYHILANDSIEGSPEWFEDKNETLCDRLKGFMKSLGYPCFVPGGPCFVPIPLCVSGDRKIMYQYLYVAQYVHNLGRSLEDVTEKKISTTLDLEAIQREMKGVSGPIVCSIMAAWKVGDKCDDVKSALYHILADDCVESSPEWFEDKNETLCDRLKGFMESLGYPCVEPDGLCDVPTPLLVWEDAESNESISGSDLVDPAPIGNSHTPRKPPNRNRVDLLVGEEFSYTRKGITNTVKVEAPGTFYSISEKRKFGTGRKAINNLYLNSQNEALKGASINWWTMPKNADGLTPDDVITKKLRLSTQDDV